MSLFTYQDAAHPRMIPERPFRWPSAPNVQNQIQQIKAAVQAPSATTVKPIAAPSTPQIVQNVRIMRTNAAGGHKIAVQFTRPTQDNYFQGVNVYLQTGKNPAVLVGAGTHSPIKLTVAKTSAPSVVFVQSTGNWGATPLANSPGKAVNLG